jgi:cell division septal protein FtsQ
LKIKTSLTILALLALIAAPVLYYNKGIRINNISCNSQYGPCNTELLENLNKVKGSNLYDARKMLSEILEKEVLVKTFIVQYRIPNSLKVDLIERKPHFGVRNADNEKITLVDSSGYVLGSSDSTNLPLLNKNGSLDMESNRVGDKEIFGLQVLEDMFTLYQVKSIQMEKDGINVDLKDGNKAIFPLEGDRDVLVGAFRLIYSQLNQDAQTSKIEGVKTPFTIDLRYKNPVIR